MLRGFSLFCRMAFSVSNEVKVGALTAIAITLLILGFNFLKGNNPIKKSQYVFAKFNSIEGLVPANPVICNGLVIGTIYKTEPADVYLNEILVTIRLTEPVLIPKDSRAVIKGNLLSTPAVEIIKGSEKKYLEKGDTLLTLTSSGFVGEMLEKLGPTQERLNNALGHLDTLLSNTNKVLDANTQANARLTMANFAVISANLTQTTDRLNKLLAEQNSTLTNTLKNVETASSQLNQGLKPLPAITANLENITKQVSEADLKKLILDMENTLLGLQQTLQKFENPKGSVGALLTDRQMYDNLNKTINSMNLLLQDFRLHPKRYVNVSVFGKKDKTTPLMKPMDQDSLTQEQYLPQKQ